MFSMIWLMFKVKINENISKLTIYIISNINNNDMM